MILGIWGVLSFMVLAGEESPMNPMPFAEYFWTKLAAAASLALCILVGVFCYRKGWLPEIDEDEEV